MSNVSENNAKLGGEKQPKPPRFENWFDNVTVIGKSQCYCCDQSFTANDYIKVELTILVKLQFFYHFKNICNKHDKFSFQNRTATQGREKMMSKNFPNLKLVIWSENGQSRTVHLIVQNSLFHQTRGDSTTDV